MDSAKYVTQHTRIYINIGNCGEGGVVQRSLQREKDSGDSGK